LVFVDDFADFSEVWLAMVEIMLAFRVAPLR
jgi:hypothetical protein